MTTRSNLPPGCSPDNIPGNSMRDAEWTAVFESGPAYRMTDTGNVFVRPDGVSVVRVGHVASGHFRPVALERVPVPTDLFNYWLSTGHMAPYCGCLDPMCPECNPDTAAYYATSATDAEIAAQLDSLD